ncbi:MAG: glycosyltransferase family 4 protein [Actinobacteria bacterium]|nr:glycosyltransferase family 4 protein [Actinomycetota bacterium]
MRPDKKYSDIHIDARMLYSSGIGRCLREIIKEIILTGKNIKIYLYCRYEDYEKFVNEYSINEKQAIFKKYNSGIYSVREQIEGSFINFRKNKSDIFFVPHYNLPYFTPANTVFTIHDFTQFKFPQYFDRKKVRFAKLILDNAVIKAKKIIVVSKSTLNDFCSFFPGLKNKARVIYNGISKDFRVISEKEKKDFLKNKNLNDYLLFIGNNKPHKNISGLLSSFKDVKQKYKSLKLVIISSGFDPSNMDIEDNIKKDIYVIDNTGDSELVHYYNCARMLVLASFYEGFGLPVLEAMACGCPVIASNISSLPELCGNAAVLVDPYDKDSISTGILKIIEDDDLKNRLVKEGLERAKLFSWADSAKKYLDEFIDILN